MDIEATLNLDFLLPSSDPTLGLHGINDSDYNLADMQVAALINASVTLRISF